MCEQISEQLRASLSALMDNEASELDVQRVLNQSQQKEVRDSWQRYHMARLAMRKAVLPRNLDISVAVRDEMLAQDMADNIDSVARPSLASVQHSVQKMLQPVASFAVAASVFASVLVASQLYGLVGVDSSDTQIATSVSPIGMANTIGGAALNANYGAPATRSVQQSPRAAYNRLAREQLRRYILPHTDKAALNTPQGMMPYARVASFRVEERAAE